MSSSLGYVGPRHTIRRPVAPATIEIRESSSTMRAPRTPRVAMLFVATGVLHLLLAIVVASTTFRYPLTVFETRIKPSVEESFVCVYEEGVIDGEPFCSSTAPDHIPTPECLPALLDYANNVATEIDPTQGPWLAAYELKQTLNDADGAKLAKGFLIAVCVITSVADVVKAAQVHMLGSAVSDGMPIMWREYAITTALLSLFLASVSQVFELSFLVASALSQAALMYFGYCIDILAGQGHCDLALVLLWQPGMALFAIVWWPIFRSVARLKPVLCKSGPLFACEPTCFEDDYGFQGLTLVSFAIFATFPLVLLYKMYAYSETPARWLGSRASNPLWVFCAFWVYVPYSFGRSLVFSVKDSCSAAAREPECKVSDETRRRTFVISNALFALLSLTSKAFITLFFVYMFATRFPWRNIQRVVGST